VGNIILKRIYLAIVFIAIIFLIGGLSVTFSNRLIVDNYVKDKLSDYQQKRITIRLSSNSSNIENFTNDFSIPNSFEVNSYGSLYVALPQTTWMFKSSYIMSGLYIGGLDARYFLGYSSFRPPFMLLYLNDSKFISQMNLEMPATGNATILLDSRYKDMDEPIFNLIRGQEKISLFTGAYSISFIYNIQYLDVRPINEYIGLPLEVPIETTKERYNLMDKPPIYILIDKDTYYSILLISEPIIKGNYYTVILDYKLDSYSDYASTLIEAEKTISFIEQLINQSGIEEYSIINALGTFLRQTFNNAVGRLSLQLIIFTFLIVFAAYGFSFIYKKRYLPKHPLSPIEKRLIRKYRTLLVIMAALIYLVVYITIVYLTNTQYYITELHYTLYILVPLVASILISRDLLRRT